MIRLTQTGVEIAPGAIEKLKAEFQEKGYAMMPGFLSEEVRKPFLEMLRQAEFKDRTEVFRHNYKPGEEFGHVVKLDVDSPPVCVLTFLTNQKALIEAAQAIAGTGPLSNFLGRIHRSIGGTDHQIDWHNDAVDYREVGLNINLNDNPNEHEGADFEIKGPSGVVNTVKPFNPGDAFFFRIDHGWSHRLTPVLWGTRTVGVGWYRSFEEPVFDFSGLASVAESGTLPETMRDEMERRKLVIGNGVLLQRLHDDIVLLNMKDQKFYGLHDSAAVIVDELLAGRTPELAAARLSELFDVDPATAVRDARALANELVAAGLLEEVPA